MERFRVLAQRAITPNHYRPSEWAYYRWPLSVFAIDVCISFTLAIALSYTELVPEVESIGIPILSVWFIPFLLLVSTIEELIFRIVPLTIAMSASERASVHVLTALVMGGIFGYVHGGVGNIFLQGIGGFLYGLLFIKYAAGGERFLEASLVVILIHTAFNGLLGVLLLLGGETMF